MLSSLAFYCTALNAERHCHIEKKKKVKALLQGLTLIIVGSIVGETILCVGASVHS